MLIGGSGDRRECIGPDFWLRGHGSKVSPSVEAQAVDGGGAGHRAGTLPDLLRHPSVIVLVISLLLSSEKRCHRAACHR